MAVEACDVLRVTIVLLGSRLVPTQEELAKFQTTLGGEVIPGSKSVNLELTTGEQSVTDVFKIERDRVSIELSQDRSQIAREYPQKSDLSRIAEIASTAISCTITEPIISSYGANIELLYGQDSNPSAFGYLGQRLFKEYLHSDGESNTTLIGGGSASFSMRRENQTSNFTIEPRFRDKTTAKVFLSLNLHVDKDSPPTKNEIERSLKQAWRQVHNFALKIDGEII